MEFSSKNCMGGSWKCIVRWFVETCRANLVYLIFGSYFSSPSLAAIKLVSSVSPATSLSLRDYEDLLMACLPIPVAVHML
jgi:hypothetical protein